MALALMITGARAQSYHTVVLDDKTTCIITDTKHSTNVYQRKIKLLNKHGNDDAQVVISLDKTNELKNFVYTVYDENGRELRKFKKKDLMRTEYSHNFKTDSYKMVMGYMPSTYPCIINIEFSVESNDGSLFYPVFSPINNYEQKVEKASYQIIAPQDITLRTYRQNTDCEIKKSINDKGQQVLSIEVQNLPAINSEPFSGYLYDIMPKVFFAPTTFYLYDTNGDASTWEKYSSYQASLYEGRQTLTDNVKQHLHELCDALATPKEKLAKVYEYFGSITRYVSIQLGIGGMQPIPAAEVCRTGYGDCKGLSNLMKSMLQEVGIESNVAIISTDVKRHPKEFSSGYEFNHVVLMVPMNKDTIWVECTNPELPLAYVHEDIADHDALLVKNTGGQLISLPCHKDINNVEHSQAEVILKEDGGAHVSLSQHWHDGYYENMHYALTQKSEEKQKDYLFSSIALMGGTIDSINIEEKTDAFEVPEVKLRAVAECRGYGTKTGQRLFIRIDPFHYGMNPLREIANRNNDITREFGYKDIDDITIIIPEGHKIESLPQNTNLSTPFGHLKIEYKLQDGKVIVHAEHYAKQGRFDAKQYPEFRKFYNQVISAYQQKMVIAQE